MIKTTLGEISINGKGEYGIGASAVEYSSDLYTYLRITDINDDGTINKNGLKSVVDENADKYILQKNDIVFARTGASTGKNYFYEEKDGTFVYAGFLIKFSLDENKVNPKFIKYYCLSQVYKDWVYSMVLGSTRGNINAKIFAELPIVLPERDYQNSAVKILSALDEKIELNNKINENLHAQAQAIFKSWFVDFEPFGGTVPSDWKETTLDSMIAISKKAFNPLKNKDIEVEHYSIPAYDESQFPIFENSNDIKSNKFVVVNNSLLLSKLNPTIKRLWKPYCLSEYAVCSTEFIVCLPKNKLYLSFIYSLLDSDNFQDFMKKHVTGSTGSHQRVKPNDILNFSFLKAPDRVIADYCLLVDNMLNKIENNMLENKKLAQIRDTLLPKLMSGELEV